MYGIIFSSLLIGNIQFITFNNFKLNIEGRKCGDATCYFIPREIIEKYKPTKIIDSSFPKKVKWECFQEGCRIKIYDQI